MKTVVVRNIKRTDAELVKRLGVLGVATAHEAYGRFGLMKPYLRPVWSGGEAAGTAVTVLVHPGDNWMIHVAVEQCKPGDILVVGCSADNTDGMFGDLLATSLMARSVRGLIIDAGVHQHGDGGAGRLAAGPDRAQIGLHQAEAAIGLMRGGDAEHAEPFNQPRIGALDVANYDRLHTNSSTAIGNSR